MFLCLSIYKILEKLEDIILFKGYIWQINVGRETTVVCNKNIGDFNLRFKATDFQIFEEKNLVLRILLAMHALIC